MKKLIFVFLFLLPVTAFADSFEDAVAKYESDIKDATNILNSKITKNTNLVTLATNQVNDDKKSTIRTAKKKFNKQLSSQEKEEEQKYQEKQKQEINEKTNSSQEHAVSSDKVSELEANAQAMRDKENSTENKLLGAASIGATGIGGSQLAQGLSEQKSDKDAETDMKAYLATFKCDYGQGQNINGGEKSITLPGGNVLMPMYTEYKTLADELKNTKTALGMAPGIESETILDKSTTGLYEYDQAERKSGAFASVSASLTGAAGDDDAWYAQKAAASKKVTTGALVAGAGIVGGIAGNMLINKNSAQESSDEINAKYAKIAAAAKEIQTEIDNKSEVTKPDCGTDAKLVGENCVCNDENKNYTENGCVDKPTVDCGNDEHIYATTDNKCLCSLGFDLVENNKCVCNPPKEIDGVFCQVKESKKTNFDSLNNNNLNSMFKSVVSKNTVSETETNIVQIEKITLTSNSFAPNEFEVKDDYKTILNDRIKDISSTDVCYLVSGNTDKTGSKETNDVLSLKRAESVKKILTNNGISELNIQTVGNGSSKCDSKTLSNSSCRNVTVEINTGSCPQG
ncbi:MAG: OmpA family protein [Alphaproteobacteria bacterium]|nr:OmpA family protein [Alphaproteobacteria bacterium]